MSTLAGDKRASGEPLSRQAWGLARQRAAFIATEVRVGSPELARLGLLALALALQTIAMNSPGHFRPSSQAFFAILVTFGTLASLALCFVGTLNLQRVLSVRSRQLLAAAALAALCILTVVSITQGVIGLRSTHGTPYTNDGAVMDLYAASRLIDGSYPYSKTNIAAALAALDAPSTTTTPLMDGQFRGIRAYPSADTIQQVFLNVLRYRSRQGVPIPPEFESKYNYPSGSFLFILPFVFAGVHDMRFLYAFAILGMGVYLWSRMPRALRPLVPFFVIANAPLIVLTTGGQPDPLYGFFLMIGYAEWSRRHLSPVAMGLAIATKQLAWFFVPFYLLFIAREFGWREAGRRGGIMASIFLVLNGPFILHSPSAYLSSIAGPMADPMFPLGMGVIALFVSSVLPMLPKIAFTVAELLAWFSTIAIFARRRGLMTPASGAVLAALPLFFAWRSLMNYFYLVPLLALAIVVADSRQRTAQRET